MTVLEVIMRSTEFLAGKGVDSPRLQTELLMAHALHLPRMQLYLNFERVLAQPEVEALRGFVKRRGQREPLQHILGTTSFCGLEMAVNRHVLVPRPETELLAERAWKFLQQLSTPSPRLPALDPRPSTALDWGTGSGCLAIALASHCPLARISAVEISREALDLAAENAQRNGVADRIQWIHGDGFGAVPSGTQFDLIVANPPYIPTAEIPSLDPEVRDHDPRVALRIPGGRRTTDARIRRRPGRAFAGNLPPTKLDCGSDRAGLHSAPESIGFTAELTQPEWKVY